MDGGKRSAWLTHVMKVKKANPSYSLGDAMKAAKKTYKKGGSMYGGAEHDDAMTGGADCGGGMYGGGGTLAGTGIAGGRRRRSRKMKGGQLYTQVGGPYVGGPDNAVTDGAARNPNFPYMAYVPERSELLGGRRRTRRGTRHGRRQTKRR